MEGLDLLKKDWNRQDKNQKHLSQNEIYPMLHKKSSSIVKTLFYISVAELIFWILINTIPLFTSIEYREKLNMVYGSPFIFTAINILSYGIILLFIYLLFKSHQAISVTDNAKKLMKSILKTRKIIKYYVLYNLTLAFIAMSIGFYFGLTKNPEIASKLYKITNSEKLIMLSIVLISTAIFVFIIWIFYKLIYGLLLKRLNQNYKELKKIEI
ncbi:hypothetical protein APS56_07560 [Pseudalgibacter alginicilyticus]|uniref:Beta-carotene 15,15'-monooxygenase n=1 Tax=Pseudalgibacter alginicilyticus TaxID=1736674 RepID=A0A0P0DAT3_9FLAO|nr:hypothetical protein [Pseudalgibacter alginicilyticus]ALJ04988.1 hypothetical protein APS56_07560 [Pseudalgibacter alginicilyticus]